MSASTGPILAVGAITIANQSVFNDEDMDWRIPVATAISAVMFAGAERAVGQTAVRLAYLALVAVVLVRVNPKVPSPAESALAWFNKGGKTA